MMRASVPKSSLGLVSAKPMYVCLVQEHAMAYGMSRTAAETRCFISIIIMISIEININSIVAIVFTKALKPVCGHESSVLEMISLSLGFRVWADGHSARREKNLLTADCTQGSHKLYTSTKQ